MKAGWKWNEASKAARNSLTPFLKFATLPPDDFKVLGEFFCRLRGCSYPNEAEKADPVPFVIPMALDQSIGIASVKKINTSSQKLLLQIVQWALAGGLKAVALEKREEATKKMKYKKDDAEEPVMGLTVQEAFDAIQARYLYHRCLTTYQYWITEVLPYVSAGTERDPKLKYSIEEMNAAFGHDLTNEDDSRTKFVIKSFKPTIRTGKKKYLAELSDYHKVRSSECIWP